MVKKMKLKNLPEISARCMSAMEFLYNFIELEDWDYFKDQWDSQGYDHRVLLYPEKVIIWLVTN